MSFAIALATAAALAVFLRCVAFGHVAATHAVFHALAVFAAVLHASAAVGFGGLVMGFAIALRATAAVSAAGALAVFTTAGAIRTSTCGLLVIAFRRWRRSGRLSNHAHGEQQRHQQYFQLHIDLHNLVKHFKSCLSVASATQKKDKSAL
jgi:vacuolar-type H+-ATPase subunit I/STV1